jgi:Zierdtviridae exonuclease
VETPILRTSERTAFRRCPQRWWWAFPCGLKSRQKPADALWFGIGIHEALADWYVDGYDRGPIPADTFEEWVGDEIRFIKANYADHDRGWFDEPVYEEAGELGIAMLDHYLDVYEDDPYLEILAIEQPFEIEIVDETGKVIAIFRSRFDGVAIDHKEGEIELLEHKTAGAIKTAHLPLDDQAGAYFAVATIVLRHQGILGKRENIAGIKYNFLRKSKPDLRERDPHGRYLNKNGEVSKRQGSPAFIREFVDRTPREVNQQIRRIADEVTIMNKMRSGELPITKSITDMCPYCPFYAMCLLHERGGTAWKDYRDAQYTVVNPYEDPRKSAAE